MRKPEQRLYDRFKRRLEPLLLLQRHEDKLSPGIPDVSYMLRTTARPFRAGQLGWVELKVVDSLPVGSLVKADVRVDQVNWMQARAAAQLVHLLLYVEDSGEYLWIHASRVSHEMRTTGLTADTWRSLVDPTCRPFMRLLTN